MDVSRTLEDQVLEEHQDLGNVRRWIVEDLSGDEAEHAPVDSVKLIFDDPPRLVQAQLLVEVVPGLLDLVLVARVPGQRVQPLTVSH